ncbi:Ras GTPase involved in M-phase terminaton [Acrasis kona]|uniref:Ras GTPase involved in M-phase terminaton n=1 Tax=Acrasis kona TaxID=1008807 RepID=A0AAW2ZNQ5_9EUKA
MSAKKSVLVKVGMLGDVQVGKTSLMVKYVSDKFDENYMMTLGVNFLEKKVDLKNNEITLMIWDLGGQKEFMGMLDLVCTDSAALFFMFDLSRKTTLQSVKEWYIQSRRYNKTAVPFLIGTKYDKFLELPTEEQAEITDQARKFAAKMKCSIVFCSAAESINVKKLFKLVTAKVFGLKANVEQITNVGEPILEYTEE